MALFCTLVFTDQKSRRFPNVRSSVHVCSSRSIADRSMFMEKTPVRTCARFTGLTTCMPERDLLSQPGLFLNLY